MTEDAKKVPPAEESGPLARRRGCGGMFVCLMLVCAALWGGVLGAFVWIVLNDKANVDVLKEFPFVRITESEKSTVEALETFRPDVGSTVYSADGEPLGEFTVEQRRLVSLSEIPLHVQEAFIAEEDDLFMMHKGVRPDAILNAALFKVTTGRTRGASTITMQVARGVETLDVGQERTFRRKIREAFTALQIERNFTKDEILELYMNQAFLGVSAFGVEAAANQYFGKHCRDLSLSEGAVLASLLPSPNKNEPFRDIERATKRRNNVLEQMLTNRFITQAEYDAAVKDRLEDSVMTPEKRAQLAAEGKDVWNPNRFKAPYFVEEVRQFVLHERDKNEVFREGLEIDTTIDMRLQRAAEECLLTALNNFDNKRLESLTKQKKESEFVPVSGALLCIDNRPGYQGFIRAMVGGRDFDKEKYNNATQATRQPGSSVKPFVWSAALADGMTPSSIEVDEPFEKTDPWGNVYVVHNFQKEYLGPLTLRSALQRSINVVSVKLTERVTPPVVRSYMQRCGIRTPINDGLAIALGASDVTILDQCVAYSCFANGGVRYDPVMVTQVKNRDGLVLYDYRAKTSKEQALPANVACVMTHLMEGVCRFGTAANTESQWEKAQPGRPRAGKTGTSNNSRNAWFCGFTPDFTCVVWLGYSDNRPLGHGTDYTGGHLANPVWTDFMIRAEEGMPVRPFVKADGVDSIMVDRESGRRGGNFEEYFLEGTEPPTETNTMPEPPSTLETSIPTESNSAPETPKINLAPEPPKGMEEMESLETL